VRSQIDDLTALHETAFDAPWHVDDAPAEFIEALQRGIVGVELRVSRWEAKRKLSQNRPADDRAGALAGMEAAGRRGADAVVHAMRER
jgi:transcriptional regulator